MIAAGETTICNIISYSRRTFSRLVLGFKRDASIQITSIIRRATIPRRVIQHDCSGEAISYLHVNKMMKGGDYRMVVTGTEEDVGGGGMPLNLTHSSRVTVQIYRPLGEVLLQSALSRQLPQLDLKRNELPSSKK